MATIRQAQVPGGAYVNEVTNSSELQMPGWQYINEDTAATATTDSGPWTRYLKIAKAADNIARMN